MIKRIRARDLFSADSSSAMITALWSENEKYIYYLITTERQGSRIKQDYNTNCKLHGI